MGEFLMAAALMADDIKQLYDMIRQGEGNLNVSLNQSDTDTASYSHNYNSISMYHQLIITIQNARV